MTDVKMTWTDYVNEVYEHTGSQGYIALPGAAVNRYKPDSDLEPLEFYVVARDGAVVAPLTDYAGSDE